MTTDTGADYLCMVYRKGRYPADIGMTKLALIRSGDMKKRFATCLNIVVASGATGACNRAVIKRADLPGGKAEMTSATV